MFESIKAWFLNHGFALSVVSVMVALNLILSGFQVFLEKVDEALRSYAGKNKTIDGVEVKLSGFLGIIEKASAALQKVVDWCQGNRAH